MTKYDDSSQRSEPLALHDARLEFPDGRDFVPVARRRAPAGFLDFCAAYLPKLRERSDYRERRMTGRCEAEFDLFHPERVAATCPVGFMDALLKGL